MSQNGLAKVACVAKTADWCEQTSPCKQKPVSLALTYRVIENLLKRTGFWTDEVNEPFASARPNTRFWAIGDVHGCSDLLDQILSQMNQDPVIFVGDLIDRGPESRKVLEKVYKLCSEDSQRYRVIKGNHEQLLLDFLSDPERVGPSWTRVGGLQTLASYGIPLSGSAPSDAACRDARDALVKKMGKPMIDWLSKLQDVWSSGNVHVVHAGADPGRPMSAQDPRDLTWGHKNFARTRRTDGQWVLHGHVIVPSPAYADGRISIDTGAYATGVLTAVHVSAQGVEFISTTPKFDATAKQF